MAMTGPGMSLSDILGRDTASGLSLKTELASMQDADIVSASSNELNHAEACPETPTDIASISKQPSIAAGHSTEAVPEVSEINWPKLQPNSTTDGQDEERMLLRADCERSFGSLRQLTASQDKRSSSALGHSTLRTMLGPLGGPLGALGNSSSSTCDEQHGLQQSSFQQLPSSSSDLVEAGLGSCLNPATPRGGKTAADAQQKSEESRGDEAELSDAESTNDEDDADASQVAHHRELNSTETAHVASAAFANLEAASRKASTLSSVAAGSRKSSAVVVGDVESDSRKASTLSSGAAGSRKASASAIVGVHTVGDDSDNRRASVLSSIAAGSRKSSAAIGIGDDTESKRVSTLSGVAAGGRNSSGATTAGVDDLDSRKASVLSSAAAGSRKSSAVIGEGADSDSRKASVLSSAAAGSRKSSAVIGEGADSDSRKASVLSGVTADSHKSSTAVSQFDSRKASAISGADSRKPSTNSLSDMGSRKSSAICDVVNMGTRKTVAFSLSEAGSRKSSAVGDVADVDSRKPSAFSLSEQGSRKGSEATAGTRKVSAMNGVDAASSESSSVLSIYPDGMNISSVAGKEENDEKDLQQDTSDAESQHADAESTGQLEGGSTLQTEGGMETAREESTEAPLISMAAHAAGTVSEHTENADAAEGATKATATAAHEASDTNAAATANAAEVAPAATATAAHEADATAAATANAWHDTGCMCACCVVRRSAKLLPSSHPLLDIRASSICSVYARPLAQLEDPQGPLGPCQGPAICCGQVRCCQEGVAGAVACEGTCAGNCRQTGGRTDGQMDGQPMHVVTEEQPAEDVQSSAPVFSGTYVGWPIIVLPGNAVQQKADRGHFVTTQGYTGAPSGAPGAHPSVTPAVARPVVPRLSIAQQQPQDAHHADAQVSTEHQALQPTNVAVPASRSSFVSISQLMQQNNPTQGPTGGPSQGPSAGSAGSLDDAQLRQHLQQQLYLLLTETILLAGTVPTTAPRRTLSAAFSAALSDSMVLNAPVVAASGRGNVFPLSPRITPTIPTNAASATVFPNTNVTATSTAAAMATMQPVFSRVSASAPATPRAVGMGNAGSGGKMGMSVGNLSPGRVPGTDMMFPDAASAEAAACWRLNAVMDCAVDAIMAMCWVPGGDSQTKLSEALQRAAEQERRIASLQSDLQTANKQLAAARKQIEDQVTAVQATKEPRSLVACQREDLREAQSDIRRLAQQLDAARSDAAAMRRAAEAAKEGMRNAKQQASIQIHALQKRLTAIDASLPPSTMQTPRQAIGVFPSEPYSPPTHPPTQDSHTSTALSHWESVPLSLAHGSVGAEGKRSSVGASGDPSEGPSPGTLQLMQAQHANSVAEGVRDDAVVDSSSVASLQHSDGSAKQIASSAKQIATLTGIHFQVSTEAGSAASTATSTAISTVDDTRPVSVAARIRQLSFHATFPGAAGVPNLNLPTAGHSYGIATALSPAPSAPLPSTFPFPTLNTTQNTATQATYPHYSSTIIPSTRHETATKSTLTLGIPPSDSPKSPQGPARGPSGGPEGIKWGRGRTPRGARLKDPGCEEWVEGFVRLQAAYKEWLEGRKMSTEDKRMKALLSKQPLVSRDPVALGHAVQQLQQMAASCGIALPLLLDDRHRYTIMGTTVSLQLLGSRLVARTGGGYTDMLDLIAVATGTKA